MKVTILHCTFKATTASGPKVTQGYPSKKLIPKFLSLKREIFLGIFLDTTDTQIPQTCTVKEIALLIRYPISKLQTHTRGLHSSLVYYATVGEHQEYTS